MKHYQDPASGLIYAYEEDGSQDEIIPKNYVAKTNLEAQAILNPPLSLNQLKANKIIQIEQWWTTASASGSVPLSLGWPIDCRRSATKNDIQNMQTLLSIKQRAGAADSDSCYSDSFGNNGIMGSDNLWHVCTVAQLRDIVIPEMELYGLERQQHALVLKYMVSQTTDQTQLDAITW